jgi:GNAT superfamily N-acetyltransferase
MASDVEHSTPNITVAKESDGPEILTLQRIAYTIEAKNYNDYPIDPLVETLEEWKETFKTHTVLKAMVNGKIIGSVRVLDKNGTCYVGRLMVHPNYQNHGIGTKLLNEVEDRFSSCSRFELFTGNKSTKNLYLYEKHGYKAFKTVPIADNLQLVFLEKLR